MTKEYYHNVYLKSDEWKTIRSQILEKYDNKCALCGKNSELNVHHLFYRDYDSGGKDDDYNLICLCKTCHFHFHEIKQLETEKIEAIKNCLINELSNNNSLKQRLKLLENDFYNAQVEACINSIGKTKTKNLNKLVSYFHFGFYVFLPEVLHKFVISYLQSTNDIEHRENKTLKIFSAYRKSKN